MMRVRLSMAAVLLVSGCGEDALQERANHPPTAVCGSDRTAALGEDVFFDASSSTDPDGDDLSFLWDFGDGQGSDGRAVSHAYAAAGVFTVTLTATDERDATGTDTAAITVTDNQAPIAVISAPTAGTAGASVHLDGSGSHDPDGTIVSYVWAYDVGGGHATAIADPVFNLVGPVGVTLNVTDDEGAADTATATVALSANYNGTWAWGLDNPNEADGGLCGDFYSSTIDIAVSGSTITLTEDGTLGDVVYTGIISGNTFSATNSMTGGGTQTIAATFTTPTHFAGTYRVVVSLLGCDLTRAVHGDKQ